MLPEPPPRSLLRVYGPILLWLGALILVGFYLLLTNIDLHTLHP